MTTAIVRALGAIKSLPPLAAESLKRHADHMLQVIGFHTTYDVPMRPLGSGDREFRHMDDARVAMRLGLVWEEFRELLADGFGIETPALAQRFRVLGEDHTDITGLLLARTGKRDGAKVADALGDIVYVCYGMALEMGYDLREVIAEIHASNLTKLGADGKPIHREDGKVLKGPNYMEPNIPAILGWEPAA